MNEKPVMDRWQITVLCLLGEPAPMPPPIPGQRHRPLPDGDGVDWHARAWEALEQRCGSGALSGAGRWRRMP